MEASVKARIEQIREWKRTWLALEGYAPKDFKKDALDHVDFLLSLVSQEAVVGMADDLPYRIVEEMGLGLTFRSCTCGQLPCARLRPLRNALNAAATSMRSACVEKVRSMATERWNRQYEAKGQASALLRAEADALNEAADALESVSIQEQGSNG